MGAAQVIAYPLTAPTAGLHPTPGLGWSRGCSVDNRPCHQGSHSLLGKQFTESDRRITAGADQGAWELGGQTGL